MFAILKKKMVFVMLKVDGPFTRQTTMFFVLVVNERRIEKLKPLKLLPSVQQTKQKNCLRDYYLKAFYFGQSILFPN